MGNLFVVYTPFQLFVAQQIVAQEGLKENVLLMSYVHGNNHFIPIYEMMEMEGMWKKKIEFEDFDQWEGVRTKNLHDIKKAYHNYKRILSILKNNDIGTIFLGEQQNTALRFTDILFSRKGYKINFFEEGSAHYILRNYQRPNLKTKIKIVLRDLFYYLPIYHVRFAKWRYVHNMPIEFLPMNKRYSIIPHYNEPYDIRLIPRTLISKKTEIYIQNAINENDKERILFLTDPLYEWIGYKYVHLYYDTVLSCFKAFKKDITVYIKFHPRELADSKTKIEKIAKNLGITYRILSGDFNIPVEYYLQRFTFSIVYIFNASTYFYNGYLFPKTIFEKLLPKIYKGLEEENAPVLIRNKIKKFIDSMNGEKFNLHK